MRAAKFAVVLMVGIASVFCVFGVARVLRAHGNDDYIIINRIMTMKDRKEFFRTLTPERKSELWRKHYTTELTKHPELTADQKAVVDLAIVIASPDLFRSNLPDPCSAGSVFRTAGENAFKDAPLLRVEIFGQPAEPLPKFAHANSLNQDSKGTCECNETSWCNACTCGCPGVHGCNVPPGTGCGCFWNSSCNATCQPCFGD
jgi:hypothetical protein